MRALSLIVVVVLSLVLSGVRSRSVVPNGTSKTVVVYNSDWHIASGAITGQVRLASRMVRRVAPDVDYWINSGDWFTGTNRVAYSHEWEASVFDSLAAALAYIDTVNGCPVGGPRGDHDAHTDGWMQDDGAGWSAADSGDIGLQFRMTAPGWNDDRVENRNVRVVDLDLMRLVFVNNITNKPREECRVSGFVTDMSNPDDGNPPRWLHGSAAMTDSFSVVGSSTYKAFVAAVTSCTKDWLILVTSQPPYNVGAFRGYNVMHQYAARPDCTYTTFGNMAQNLRTLAVDRNGKRMGVDVWCASHHHVTAATKGIRNDSLNTSSSADSVVRYVVGGFSQASHVGVVAEWDSVSSTDGTMCYPDTCWRENHPTHGRNAWLRHEWLPGDCLAWYAPMTGQAGGGPLYKPGVWRFSAWRTGTLKHFEIALWDSTAAMKAEMEPIYRQAWSK